MTVEESLICGLMTDSSAVEGLDLSPEMFENPSLGLAFYEFQRGADANIILDKYKSDEIMMYNLRPCIEGFAFSSLIPKYAREVKNNWKKRRADEIVSQVLFNSSDIDSQLRELTERLSDLKEQKEDSEHTLGELVDIYKDQCFTEHEFIGTGFFRLDTCLGGLERGDVVIIGARPAVGKSALGLQLAKHFQKSGLAVGYFNLEMLDKQIYQRFVAQESGISLGRIRNAKKFQDDKEKEIFSRANGRLSESNVHLFTGGKTVADIRAKSKNFDVVIVDYLQLVEARSTYSGNRVQEVSEVSRELKNLASDLHSVVIVLSQLNRETERKKRPTLSDLRESGAIEQDASVVLLMWRQGEDRAMSVEKNRQGNLGEFVYEFDGPHMTFKETNKRVSKKSDDDEFHSIDDEKVAKQVEEMFK